MRKHLCVCLWAGLLCVFVLGCSAENEERVKVQELDFTVTATENIPNELLVVLEETKTDAFYRAYSDGEFMYLCVGYGEQATGGYSITVDDLYLTEEAVCMATTLVGPNAAEEVTKMPSYPYVVVCTEYMDKPIVFE